MCGARMETVHQTSTGLQVLRVVGIAGVDYILVSETARAGFPMTDIEWRELQMLLVAEYGIQQPLHQLSPAPKVALVG